MDKNRKARLEGVILRELSTLISLKVKDPRVPTVTVTSVNVSPDVRQATAYVSTFDNSEIPDCLDGLNSASGYLRRNLAKSLDLKHIPTLYFKEDRGLENTLRVHELLKQI